MLILAHCTEQTARKRTSFQWKKSGDGQSTQALKQQSILYIPDTKTKQEDTGSDDRMKSK